MKGTVLLLASTVSAKGSVARKTAFAVRHPSTYFTT